MYAKLLGFLLFACQIILNSSSVIFAHRNSVLAKPQPATVREGYVSFPEDNAAYKIYKELTTWTQARDRCIAENAHLAITDTREKIVHINSLKEENWGSQWLHVGIYRESLHSDWIRVDNGLPLTSLPWADNYPDNYGDAVGISLSEDAILNYYGEVADDYFVCEVAI